MRSKIQIIFSVLLCGAVGFGAGAPPQAVPSMMMQQAPPAKKNAKSSVQFAFDGGLYVPLLFERLRAPAGFENDISQLSGYVRLRPSIGTGDNVFFEPSLAALLPWRSTADGNTKTFTTQADLDLNFPIYNFFRLRLGAGLMWTYMTGSGQEVALNNGSTTAYTTFYAPAGSSHIFNFTIESGLEIQFSHTFSLNLDLYCLNILNGDRRIYNGAASLGITL